MIRFLTGALIYFVLAVSGLAQVSVGLAWTASTDNVGVAGYNVYRDGVKIGTSPTSSYTDASAAENTTYSYTVQAFDAAGNVSGTAQPAIILTGFKHGGGGAGGTVNAPGPSAALFNAPYYSCTRNFYVNASTGLDSRTAAQAQSPATPWLTIAKYDTTATAAGGDCINVAAGTYALFNGGLTQGGSSAASSGYVAYRCTTPAFVSGSGCIITDNNKAVCAGNNCGNSFPNYLFFDGFNFISSNRTTANGTAFVCTTSGDVANASGCHHWFMINNVIDGYGLAGVGINNTEFIYVSHNTITQNAHQGCNGFYGSGVGIVIPSPVSGYSKTADDTNANSNVALNLLGIQGTSFPFNIMISWNVLGNNYQGCSPAGQNQSDGNGIIIDTFLNSNCNLRTFTYTNQTLVAFNVVYNSGGVNIHIFGSGFTTVANNSTYNGRLDPTIPNFVGPGIDTSCGQSTTHVGANTNLFLNNIAVAIPDALSCSGLAPGARSPYSFGNNNSSGGGDATYNTPGKNISLYIGSTPCNANSNGGNSVFDGNAAYDCAANQCQADPKWVNVGNSAIGDETTPPNGTNFALQGTSPAINTGATQTYLSSQSVDAGACYHTLTTCP